MKKLDFIIIGFPKCGTTSAVKYLNTDNVEHHRS